MPEQVDYAALARQAGAVSSTPPPSSGVPLDDRGMPRVASRTSDYERPSDLNQLLGPLAHPQTLTDFATLLTLPVDTVRKALIGALAPRIAGDVATSVGNAAKSAWSATKETLEPLADNLITKKLGIDPDALDLAAAKMRLQAAKSVTRQAKISQQIANAQAPEPATAAPAETPGAYPGGARTFAQGPGEGPGGATSPVGSSPASTAQGTPAAQRSAGPPVPTLNPKIVELVQALKVDGGLSDSEAAQAYQWFAKGATPQVVVKRIQDVRALQQTGAFAKLPTTSESEATVAARNADPRGRWPK